MAWAEESAERGTVWTLVDALRKITCLADHGGRALVARMVCDELGEQLPFQEHKQAVMHLYSLAEVCTQHPKGLTTLLRVLERIEPDTRPVTTLRATVGGMMTRQGILPLVDALLTSRTMLDDEERRLVVSRLRPEIAQSVRYRARARLHVIEIVRTCLDYEGGLPELLRALRELEGDSFPVRRSEEAMRALPQEDLGN